MVKTSQVGSHTREHHKPVSKPKMVVVSLQSLAARTLVVSTCVCTAAQQRFAIPASRTRLDNSPRFPVTPRWEGDDTSQFPKQRPINCALKHLPHSTPQLAAQNIKIMARNRLSSFLHTHRFFPPFLFFLPFPFAFSASDCNLLLSSSSSNSIFHFLQSFL